MLMEELAEYTMTIPMQQSISTGKRSRFSLKKGWMGWGLFFSIFPPIF